MSVSYSSHTEAVAALKAGKPVIFPTDTLFGLGVSVEHALGNSELYRLKNREADKPIAWLVGGVEDLERYGRVIPPLAFTLARKFWPGPLTIIVKASDAVPAAFLPTQKTIGLRMPNNHEALALIEEVGCPIATTSANLSGEEPTVSFDQIDAQLIAQVAAALDDDEIKSGIASTIVDCTGDYPQVMRVGAISTKHIKACL